MIACRYMSRNSARLAVAELVVHYRSDAHRGLVDFLQEINYSCSGTGWRCTIIGHLGDSRPSFF